MNGESLVIKVGTWNPSVSASSRIITLQSGGNSYTSKANGPLGVRELRFTPVEIQKTNWPISFAKICLQCLP